MKLNKISATIVDDWAETSTQDVLIRRQSFTDSTLTFGWKHDKKFFDVLLIVHLSIILVINQLNAQNLVL